MTVSLVKWRAVMGNLNCQVVVIPKNHLSNESKNVICLFEILLVCSLLVWHWNLNSLSAHDFSKLTHNFI